MDYSDSSSANTSEAHRHGVLRALISAATFGTLGALTGRWLGRHGNDPTSNMAEPMMKWSMGIFCGLLGAYSSLKTTERIENEQTTANAIAEKQAAVNERLDKTPTRVSASTHEGKLAPNATHVALEK